MQLPKVEEDAEAAAAGAPKPERRKSFMAILS